ncbi:MAG: bifunctional chorismate mutase/prephenate dehydratase, partial [Nitrospirae bacterium RIFCSPLOWO2_12_FULL_63_8]
MSASDIVVAFQGEMGAFSEMAARAYFHEAVAVAPKSSFSELFEAVEGGACTHGMVPVENSLAGSIHENYDLLLKHDLQIVGEIKLRIVHNLIVNPGIRLEQIRKVYSHPQALAQCSAFLRTLEGAKPVVDYDTAGAAKRLKETGEPEAAAVASAQAAIDYGLEVLRAGIENNHQNYTRFLVVAREGIQPEGPSKTSIVFALKSVPGALFKSLSVFALRDI